MRSASGFSLLILAFGSLSCGGSDTAALPAPVCGEGTAWSSGEEAFVEATERWGLSGVQGVRLSVTDIDGDGWADLEVRRGSGAIDDFSSNDTRRTWLMRNTGAGFEDVTQSSGILTRRVDAEGGRPVEVVAWADVDNDGDLDLYTGLETDDAETVGGETSELLLNDGDGHFVLAAASLALRRADEVDMPAGASFVDVDLDGVVDLWTPQHNYTSGSSLVFQQDLLYRGDGAGGFSDVTDALGLTTSDWRTFADLNAGLSHTRAWSAAACDLNGDGYAELLAASYGRSPNHLWQAQPTSDGVEYENRSVASGYAYDDNQTWTDNQFADCYCASNPDAEDCDQADTPLITCSSDNWNHDQDRQAFRLGGNSGATLCRDIDNDGDVDLLTTEIRHWWAGTGSDGSEILVNDGAASPVFSRPGDEALGLAIDHSTSTSWDEGHMTGALLDFDNDGWTDVYIGGSDYAGNRGLLYRQTSPLQFTEVPPEVGIDHNRSHGVVYADFDRDGDLDVIVGHSRARCDADAPNNCYETTQVRAFENVAGDGGNFVQVRLTGGEGTNRAAIGARVRVTAGGVTQTQEVTAGHGHYGSQRDLVLHFGLGAACEAEVEVRWPNRALHTETFTLPAGHRFELVEGEAPTVSSR